MARCGLDTKMTTWLNSRVSSKSTSLRFFSFSDNFTKYWIRPCSVSLVLSMNTSSGCKMTKKRKKKGVRNGERVGCRMVTPNENEAESHKRILNNVFQVVARPMQHSRTREAIHASKS